jgi:hypothetical protein
LKSVEELLAASDREPSDGAPGGGVLIVITVGDL